VSSETRERILAVAARLFRERGFGATGVATILREAGVNSGSLYHFFPSKGLVLQAVLQRHRDRIRPAIFAPAESATADPIKRVFALLDGYRRGLLATGCTQGCMIGNLALEVSGTDPRVQALVDSNLSVWAESVRSWLDAAGERLPSGLDRRALSRFVLAVMEGAVMQARAAGRIEPFDASVSQLRAYLTLLQERAQRQKGQNLAADGAASASSETIAVEADEGAGNPAEWRSW